MAKTTKPSRFSWLMTGVIVGAFAVNAANWVRACGGPEPAMQRADAALESAGVYRTVDALAMRVHTAWNAGKHATPHPSGDE